MRQANTNHGLGYSIYTKKSAQARADGMLPRALPLAAAMRDALDAVDIDDFASTSDDESRTSSCARPDCASPDQSAELEGDGIFGVEHASLLRELGIAEEEHEAPSVPSSTPLPKRDWVGAAVEGFRAQATDRVYPGDGLGLGRPPVAGSPFGAPYGTPIAPDADVVRLRKSVSVLSTNLRANDEQLKQLSKEHKDTVASLESARRDADNLR